MISRLGPRRSVHHAGTYLLVPALALLLVPIVTSPFSGVAMMRVKPDDGSQSVVHMGLFGYCVSDPVTGSSRTCHYGYTAGAPHSHSPHLQAAAAGLHVVALAAAAVALAASVAVSLCFKTTRYLWPWVATAAAAIATAAAVAVDFRWVAAASNVGGFSRVRVGAGAVTPVVALALQLGVAAAGCAVWWLGGGSERRPRPVVPRPKHWSSDEQMQHIDEDRLYDDEDGDGDDPLATPGDLAVHKGGSGLGGSSASGLMRVGARLWGRARADGGGSGPIDIRALGLFAPRVMMRI
ncbi:hypothetical protein GGR56DRAFT_675434 [Xylariaceae sp. FL0804]|nr:hypothetical protein GGR56DRAFT_675434 [Xylariaceae sp. FL0804]